jgi:hypothetical protein
LSEKINLHCGHLNDNISGHLSDKISIDTKIYVTEAMQQISDICKNFASLDNKSKFIWLLSNENIIIINIVIKLLMLLTETRTKLVTNISLIPVML